MEFLFNLLKQLATTLSPTEFIIVIAIVLGTSFYVVRVMLKIGGRKGMFAGIFGLEDPNDVINKKLDSIGVLQTSIVGGLDNLKESFDEQRREHAIHDEALKHHLSEMGIIKRELDHMKQEINGAANDLKQLIQLGVHQSQSSKEQIILTIQRSQDILQRVENSISKVDEFARASTPEFRGNFKELSKEISELSRDIALVERSVQTQINNSSAVKLR